MPKSKRRQPGLPGLAGLAIEDFARWKRKEVTLDDLADRCGVSKQAVSKWMQKQSADRVSNSQPSSKQNVGDSDDGQISVLEFTEDEATRLAKSGAFAVLLKAHNVVTKSVDLGPSAIKAAGSAIGAAIDDLQRLGVIAYKVPSSEPTDLSIHMMTEDEEDKIRRSGEEDDDQ